MPPLAAHGYKSTRPYRFPCPCLPPFVPPWSNFVCDLWLHLAAQIAVVCLVHPPRGNGKPLACREFTARQDGLQSGSGLRPGLCPRPSHRVAGLVLPDAFLSIFYALRSGTSPISPENHRGLLARLSGFALASLAFGLFLYWLRPRFLLYSMNRSRHFSTSLCTHRSMSFVSFPTSSPE